MPTEKAHAEPAPTPPPECAGCGSNLQGFDPALAACPDCGHARGAPRPRFCIGCGYDLLGIESAPAICPECGRGFDPDDPETTSPLARSPMMSRRMRRIALPLVAVLLVVTGFVHTILPRPADLTDWRLWVWMHKKYGVEVTWVSGGQRRINWWANRISGIHALTGRDDPLWDVTWRWPDHWVVRAHRAGVDQRDLSWAFTNMKREMFGVQIGPSTREATDGPLEFVGTKVDVFSEMVRYFGTEVSPFLLRANQPYVWLFDRELGRMVAVNRDKAAAMGYELSLARGGERSEPLIEPPAGDSPAFERSSEGPSP